MIPYPPITSPERYTFGLLRQRGLLRAAMARLLGRNRSTTGRALRRNISASDGSSCRPPLAHWYARRRRGPVAVWAFGRRHRVGRPPGRRVHSHAC
jgi:IS30 family transposase